MKTKSHPRYGGLRGDMFYDVIHNKCPQATESVNIKSVATGLQIAVGVALCQPESGDHLFVFGVLLPHLL